MYFQIFNNDQYRMFLNCRYLRPSNRHCVSFTRSHPCMRFKSLLYISYGMFLNCINFAADGTMEYFEFQAPQTMQWAVRQREQSSSRTTAATGGGTTASTGGLIYIDPATLRRTSACAIPTTPTNQDNQLTMATTNSQLARAFGIVIRQIADLLTMLQDYHALAPNLPRVLEVSYQEAMDLQMYLEFHLKVRFTCSSNC